MEILLKEQKVNSTYNCIAFEKMLCQFIIHDFLLNTWWLGGRTFMTLLLQLLMYKYSLLTRYVEFDRLFLFTSIKSSC